MSSTTPESDNNPEPNKGRGPRRGGMGGGGQGPGRSVMELLRSPRGRVWVPTVLVLVVLALVAWAVGTFATDWMWFSSVGYSGVLRTIAMTKVGLFVAFALLTAVVVVVNFLVAYRTRPVYVPTNPSQQSLQSYRNMLEPYKRLLVAGVAILLALLVGSSAASQWEIFQMWLHSQNFGISDPQFGRDVAFYAFQLPWWFFLLSFVVTMVVVALLVAVVTHYLYGGLRLQGPGQRTTAAARVHLSVLLGIFVLSRAVGSWLDRYDLAVKHSSTTIGNGEGGFTGLSYTDVHAVIGAKMALAVIALLCALLFFVNVVRRTWKLPAIGVALLLVSTVVIGGIVPQVVQQFQVRPSQQQLEKPYLERHIAATRAAYGIENTQVANYDPRQLAQQEVAGQADQQLAGARLMDPNVVSPTFLQQQQNRGYYRFAPALDVDRYTLNGQREEVVVGVREINPADSQRQRNWQNDHTVYTHGMGVVAARADAATSKGEPEYIERDVPPTGQLGTYEPRIYFGEYSPTYSIVGGPAGATPQELDFQTDQGQESYTYQGAGGVPVGSFIRKLLYAMKYQEINIFLSQSVNNDSKILYDRNPRERVQKVAPWLKLDGDPYPSVINGRVMWMIDGYTTTAQYPYSLHTQLDQTTEDSMAQRGNIAAQPREQINYIRNSVKATVDAYDGSVNLYAWDEQDPVLKVWRSVFPGVVKDRAEMEKVPGLLDHVRYPQDLFKVQRTLLGNYHQTDPDQFYNSSDLWQTPRDPASNTGQGLNQPPYYLSVQLPGQQQAQYSLTTTFVPRQRQNLTGFMSVNSQYTGPGSDYGKINVLRMTSATPVTGPEQFVQLFRANESVRQQLALLEMGEARTIVGNVLTLPAAQGLVYVAPVYVQYTNTANAFPLLQLVGVGSGQQVGVGRTLAEALQNLGRAPASSGATPTPADGTPTPAGTGTAGATTGTPTPPLAAPEHPITMTEPMRQALDQARKAQSDSDAALARQGGPDWVAFGQAQKRLSEQLNRLYDLQAEAIKARNASPTPGSGSTTGQTSTTTGSPTSQATAPGR